MIKILIITDKRQTWYHILLNMMDFDTIIDRKEEMQLINKMFTFSIIENYKENKRGAAYSHIILDKQVDEELYYRVLLPSVKQRVTAHGLDKIIAN